VKTAIVVGSARNKGNTDKLSLEVASKMTATHFNLSDYHISNFDYEFDHVNDDFLKLMKKLLSFDRIILATPVYWYCASGVMKTFLDRFSDLLKVNKDLGRKLRGKPTALIATGCDLVPAPCFEEAFKLSYAYLGMTYQGMLYCCVEDDIDVSHYQQQIKQFIGVLNAKY
jgi:multimeric flavodoxin WrbA